ncbi:Glutamate synthase large subunit (Ferredoxin) [Propionibacterium freudenreichii]|uniref:glutamate synthase large subunit n=1 Tax=Propionibacterium freudenreichii TaxID=1744 RepID=UPI000544263E|nr:glutamate synthase large subunit [Propionibacterium freudenreichii]CEH03213.1 Glutamate synthase large subunit (Ferredoxin) [Propionibacterium freudenreichii]
MALPEKQGLYDPAYEHDSCGVAFVAKLDGHPSHATVEQGLEALVNLDHRGATGADPAAGDGAGILVQMPDAFFRGAVDFMLPPTGQYAAGMAFLPTDEEEREMAMISIEKIAIEERLKVLGWRTVPVATSTLSPISLGVMPHMAQLFVSARDGSAGIDLDRKVYMVRRRAEHETNTYFASLSARTIVYKGMLTTTQLTEIYPELHDPVFASALALVHSRFSTNTFPSWKFAHPYRMIAHNGEFNTVKGNRNWMRAREALLHCDVIPGDLERAFPICTPGGSDSASFDEVLELLHLAGRSLPHAVMMMIPEAWQHNDAMPPSHRDFYSYHASLMEPWDGPACVAFTDGTLIGATLDRNGLRPARYWITDDRVIFASEAGVLPVEPGDIRQKGRLQPGRMLLIDLAKHQVIDDQQVKDELARQEPYGSWLRDGLVSINDLPERTHIVHSHSSVTRRQEVFGYTHELLRRIVAPMANLGRDVIGSMGNDAPLAVLSDRPKSLFDFFTQQFAQVTNPPLDAIREQMVTSLESRIGPEDNLLDPTGDSSRQLVIPYPIIDSEQLAKIVHLGEAPDHTGGQTRTIHGLYEVRGGADALAARLDEIRREVDQAIADDIRVIVLSDRHGNAELAPIPSLLLTSMMHQYLVEKRQRARIGLVVEAGDVREVHHAALLFAYGAAVINPYLLFESAEDLARHELYVNVSPEQAIENVSQALGKGLLTIMSKMGVSTLASYRGAQLFEAVGLNHELIDNYFAGTSSRVEGIGLPELAEEIRFHHERAYPENGNSLPHRTLEVGGELQWRREGEQHLFDPESIFRLQQATRRGDYEQFKRYTERINDNSSRLMTLRSLLKFRHDRPAVPLDEVEPASEIIKRFSTGAMSYGSIGQEAHETMAIAMNRLHARSNTGEGGEDPERLHDIERCSAIKQVASGRFGVTSEYLSYASDLQIKMAQGAKPGEGGHLPGEKVYPWIARTRHATPGVGLISPPPHHDIYSIEDIKQLIHDLKCANPSARIHVKLVSEVGVGTVAAGVSKAKADVVLISGHDGGTGAAPLTSIKHAGGPWELGLAEAQQTLLLNGLRDRIVVQCDGQLKTGRDVVIAALLGAEEFGFATTALVSMGCVMMRVCHLDTCPQGIATQNPELRKVFDGKPEYVINFMEFMAEQTREILAELGFRSIQEAVGHVEALDTAPAVDHWKARGIDLAAVLHRVDVPEGTSLYRTTMQDHELAGTVDEQLVELARPALERGEHVHAELAVRNVNRTVGTVLGHEVTMATDGKGLPDDTIDLDFHGTAGQSFGAFLPRGITMTLVGDANDYLAKGLSGGRIIVRAPAESTFDQSTQIIAGNVIAYGATSGEIFLRGLVGERFCVRNSGATAVVEGVGDHGCEYMTGGEALVIGPTGRNFAAGMSGGVVWVLDLAPEHFNASLADAVAVNELDMARIRELLARHVELTGSDVAAALLEDPRLAERMTKIVPRDYARVLAARQDAEKRGASEEEVTDAMMEAARG